MISDRFSYDIYVNACNVILHFAELMSIRKCFGVIIMNVKCQ